jgi:lysozyme
MNKITKIGKKGVDLIKSFEGFSAKPYLCPAGVPTIGYGSTFYEDKSKVKMLDKPISKERAETLLKNTLIDFEKYVDSYCIDTLSQNQFDAVTSFCYNLGPTNLKSSTLLKKINANKDDVTIKQEFLKWNKASGKQLKGLTKRREAEATLYFTK